MLKPLQIIGCGPGGRSFLTLGGLDAALACDCLLGAPHLLELFPEFTGPRMHCAPHSQDAIAQIVALRAQYAQIAVLVSGDTGLCSLAAPVLKHFGPELCALHPGISSIQLACARLGLGWEHATIISAHAALPSEITDAWQNSSLILVLAGSVAAVTWCAQLARQLGSCYTATACSNLGMTDECITRIHAWDMLTLPTRSVIVFKQENAT